MKKQICGEGLGFRREKVSEERRRMEGEREGKSAGIGVIWWGNMRKI